MYLLGKRAPPVFSSSPKGKLQVSCLLLSRMETSEAYLECGLCHNRHCTVSSHPIKQPTCWGTLLTFKGATWNVRHENVMRVAHKIPIMSHVWYLLKISCAYGMPFASVKDTLIMTAFWSKAIACIIQIQKFPLTICILIIQSTLLRQSAAEQKLSSNHLNTLIRTLHRSIASC